MKSEPTYQAIPKTLYEQLIQRVSPSHDFMPSLDYYPCEVTLLDGRIFDRVYIVQQDAYIKVWGVYPKDDRGKREIRIENVLEIRESKYRLPPHFANKLYEAGETGMGYCVFTVEFSDHTTKVFITGNAVDFISYPLGQTQENVIDVHPHKGRANTKTDSGPDYYWCIYSGIAK